MTIKATVVSVDSLQIKGIPAYDGKRYIITTESYIIYILQEGTAAQGHNGATA
jgi:hypothetical protein